MSRPVSAKFVISGGFGAGKTTYVTSVSEIKPLRTEGEMTSKGIGVDDGTKVPGKTTTTVAMDFGRLTIDESLVVYLFGTPGQDRFGFMWDDLSEGALGAIVLVDTRRLDECYPALDYFEAKGIPFVMALNQFQGADEHDIEEVRYALNIDSAVPMIHCDARKTDSVRNVMVRLCHHVLSRISEQAAESKDSSGSDAEEVDSDDAVPQPAG